MSSDFKSLIRVHPVSRVLCINSPDSADIINVSPQRAQDSGYTSLSSGFGISFRFRMSYFINASSSARVYKIYSESTYNACEPYTRSSTRSVLSSSYPSESFSIGIRQIVTICSRAPLIRSGSNFSKYSQSASTNQTFPEPPTGINVSPDPSSLVWITPSISSLRTVWYRFVSEQNGYVSAADLCSPSSEIAGPEASDGLPAYSPPQPHSMAASSPRLIPIRILRPTFVHLFKNTLRQRSRPKGVKMITFYHTGYTLFSLSASVASTLVRCASRYLKNSVATCGNNA